MLFAASVDSDDSGGSQTYIIDPVAATITAVRGIAGGAGGGGGFSPHGAGGSGGNGGGGGSGSELGAFGALPGSTPGAHGLTLLATTSPDPTENPMATDQNVSCDLFAPALVQECTSAPTSATAGTVIVFAPERLAAPGRLFEPVDSVPPSDFVLGGGGDGGTDSGKSGGSGGGGDPNSLAAIPLQVPEPMPLALLGIALAAFGVTRRLKTRR